MQDGRRAIVASRTIRAAKNGVCWRGEGDARLWRPSEAPGGARSRPGSHLPCVRVIACLQPRWGAKREGFGTRTAREAGDRGGRERCRRLECRGGADASAQERHGSTVNRPLPVVLDVRADLAVPSAPTTRVGSITRVYTLGLAGMGRAASLASRSGASPSPQEDACLWRPLPGSRKLRPGSSIEFIPIKLLAAMDSSAPGSCAGHNRVPSPDRGRPPSTSGSGLSQCGSA